MTHRLLGRRYVRALSELTLLGLLARPSRRAPPQRRDDRAAAAAGRPGAVDRRDRRPTWLHDPAQAVGRSTARLWGALVPPVARRAQRLLTYAEATRTDVHQQLGIPLARIDAVPLGPGAENRVLPTPEGELRERIGLGAGRVVLTVWRKRPHKNLRRLVQAFRRVRARVPDAVLVMPGNPTEHEQELRRSLTRSGFPTPFAFPPTSARPTSKASSAWPSASSSRRCERGSAFPFSRRCGEGSPSPAPTPPALPEVAGDAARYFDPTSVEEMAAAIAELLEDRGLAARLGEAGTRPPGALHVAPDRRADARVLRTRVGSGSSVTTMTPRRRR